MKDLACFRNRDTETCLAFLNRIGSLEPALNTNDGYLSSKWSCLIYA
jgi:hypothetical protein